MNYPIDISINYITTQEYRKDIRRLFSMISYIPCNSDIDAETTDEWNYDKDATHHFITLVYDATKDCPQMMELYQKAAALMISESEDIGMVVLFSFDSVSYTHLTLPTNREV